jgi:aspartate--ammonia ligase
MQHTIKTQHMILDRIETEKALVELKDYFKKDLSKQLNLMEVSAPMIVTSGTGINDDLNGIEKPVRFLAKSYPDRKLEIVQSLAKWKRLKIGELNLPIGQGIITDMKALRPDEIISPIHSIFVDQWDWEKHIRKEDRNIEFLKRTVEQIYESIKETERYISVLYPTISPTLPEKINFIHSEELQYRYPKLTPRERENVVAKDYGAVFIMGIGYELSDGVPHDLRAPDYDDWSTQTTGKNRGLNGDIIVWNPVLKSAFEISSMGIRVDKKALLRQLKLTKNENRLDLNFHKRLMNDELLLTIGGGIGQSRLAMFLLKKRSISEVQANIGCF